MNLWTVIAFASLTLAAIPCGLFLANLFVYRPLARSSRRQEAHLENPKLETRNSKHHSAPPDVGCSPVSVLIPARNEEASIRAALASVLANRGVDIEVLVLDDHSTDRTAQIVQELASADPRVRLLTGEPLPAGWCGKQFACHTLAQQARHPLLVFMDADVRLAPDALARMAEFMGGGNCDLRITNYDPAARARVNRHSPFANPPALASGVPRQLTGTFLERLLIPLIHFVLLGFLPMMAMRRSVKEKFAAGCGQLFIARRDAYFAAGGHAAIRGSLHDGVKLPRAFRRAGFRTDLFDATDLATCRMYQTNAETWRGLGKNATEGLGAPGVLPVMTALLLGGQVLPFALLAALPWLPAGAVQPALAAALCAWIPRFIAARRFRHSPLGALLHPLGVALLLVIQWQARPRQRAGAPMTWKGRDYPGLSANPRAPRPKLAPQTLLLPALAALLIVSPGGGHAEPLPACAPFTLDDQYRQSHTVSFPREKPLVLLIADKEGSAQINPWIAALKQRFGGRVDFAGVADVRSAPGFLRGLVRGRFREKFQHPVMLDWTGRIVDRLEARPGVVSVCVLDRKGTELVRVTGPAGGPNLQPVTDALERALGDRGQRLSSAVAGDGSPRPAAASSVGLGAVTTDPTTQKPKP
jgi:hypothetical protein